MLPDGAPPLYGEIFLMAQAGQRLQIQKQLTIGFERGAVSQSKLDDLILTFVVDTSQAFSVVEAPSFVKMVKSLAPKCSVLTRRMLMTRMEASCDAMKLRLKATLGDVTYVTVTADCWTTFRRSYLAATVSWLEPSLSRKSAVLLCRRMTGRVTYDKIADTLQKSFDDYGLRGKVTKVITDNGANFVKAFRLFGEKDVEDAHHDEDDDAFTEAVEVAPLLNNVPAGEARLPPHHRCSAHLELGSDGGCVGG
ncbi:uncharacterized protein LOC120846167 [Ixodes scapularis]|uniref:uncharacterized protein LOC120846167 n=1 Tax=Ixodes scapularis TaxID=6945 RepID=UPI001A9FFEF1|nr:uncharacterized protein LOC120846167 [Ixodes scapularis]